MASDKKQERQIQQELETRIKEIRQHLSEQLKALDTRAEVQRELITDYQDYFRQRADVETQYAKDLEKLHDRTVRKQRQSQSQREKDATPPCPQMCWNLLLDMTKNHCRQHTTLSQVFSFNMANKFGVMRDELDNVYRKSREMTVEVHNEILRILNELFAETKCYHAAHSAYKTMEEKLHQVSSDLDKARKKGKKVKEHEKQLDKGLQKLNSANVKAAKARNDYLLVTSSANATIDKYFGTNVTELIDCLDLNYVRKTQKMMYAFQTSLCQMVRLQQDDLQRLELNIRQMSSGKDKEAFFEAHQMAFAAPEAFQFYPHGGDQINYVVADIYPLSEELKSKHDTLGDRIGQLEADTNETKKKLTEMLDTWEHDNSNPNEEEIQSQFRSLKGVESSELTRAPSMKRIRTPQTEELSYLLNFKDQLDKGNALCRMQARRDLIKTAIGPDAPRDHSNKIMNHMNLRSGHLRERPGSVYMRLFGGDLQQYLTSGDFQIPPVVESCIDYITVYGLNHHGIFRLPGSHLEINDMKEQFEKGKDPIYGLGEQGDVNVVASVLKAYFRELPEPLFPIDMFDRFMDCIKLPSGKERIDALTAMIAELPTSVMIIMRYLFSFLKTLSQYSDEHMMDAHNLALCFGPTLIRPPEGYDEVAYQCNINDLVDTMILFQNEIFPSKPGPIFTLDSNADLSPAGSLETIPESVIDDGDGGIDMPLIATAREDYQGKSPDELSFYRGDSLKLYQRVNDKWWKGARGDQQGLVLESYVTLSDSLIERSGSLVSSTTSSTTASPDHVRHNSDELRLNTDNDDPNPSASTPDIVRDAVRPFTYPMPGGNYSTPTTPTGSASKKPPPVKPRPTRPTRPHKPSALMSPSKSQTL